MVIDVVIILRIAVETRRGGDDLERIHEGGYDRSPLNP
jgi:hypothetical protein